MIVVRDIFQIKFGKAAEFKAAMLEGKKFFDAAGMKDVRMMSDVVANFYTFVLESSFDSLTAMEAAFATGMSNSEWRNWYHNTVCPLCESGRREIFSVFG